LVEEADILGELGGKADLIISAHTFEHLDRPLEVLKKLMREAEDEALFVFEVPSFDCLLSNCRIDQIFHQHIQYFSLASFLKMIERAGGEYLQHRFNYDYWGGTMLVAFKKKMGKEFRSSNHATTLPTEAQVDKSYRWFSEQLTATMKLIERPETLPIYGFGGAQMVPTLAYHMKSDLSFLECILDDDPRRSDLRYPNLSVCIRRPPDGFTLEGASVLVTALDSMRPILKRTMELKARHIICPLNLF